MERDFMGLNSKDSPVVVKEEADEGCKDTAFSKGSGAQWPMSNKVSALPHFMSFKVAQDEKTAKAMPDPLASSGFMALSTPDAFETTHKRPFGEMQKIHNGKGGSHFSMTAYPLQHNALSVHIVPDVKILPATNQQTAVPVRNSFFKPHFAGPGHNIAGAAMKHQLFGGIPATGPHSMLPSIGSVSGAIEPWFNSKSSGAPAQLTIFYAGTVNVYEDIPPEKAQAIMFLAGNGIASASSTTQPKVHVQVSKQAGGDGVIVNQPNNAPPSSGLSSPMSVSSHPVGQPGNTSVINDEVMDVKPTGLLGIPVNKVDLPKTFNSLGPLTATTMVPAVPQARKASLARFLEKRKERMMSSVPYHLSKKSPECATAGSNDAASP
ncbi:protein TIFY 6B-like isoform X3 [Diospyros lotus]|uniref:protein TIFY 6B-like isoform X3 n=1 Tax=Diospyros lotus TaxID=55363 RepID=UPI0022589616|nr:protein TIFY 6B-like isoform X3 [Diospyros lotus]